MNTQRKLIAAMSLCAAVAIPNIASAIGISGQGTWETTLQGRDLDGDLSNGFEAYYDTVLDITWLADANHGAGSAYDDRFLDEYGDYFGTTTDGLMSWANANAWAASLNPYDSGITGWRLPMANPIDGTTPGDETFSYIGTEDRGYNVSAPGTLYAGSTASEMAHIFHNTLGNVGRYDTSGNDQSGYGLTNTGPFSNLQDASYWSATEYAFTDDDWATIGDEWSGAWFFYFSIGFQGYTDRNKNLYAWAVHDGDVGASVVPVPAAAWLFASGLLGLIGVARKNSAQ